MKKLILIVLISTFLISLKIEAKEEIRVLIFSGKSNHNWEQTTKQLEGIFSSNKMFSYKITFQPDTLKSGDLKGFDVILNNWNSWPENEERWKETTDQRILAFIKNGGGFVTFHASSSVFYEWPEFKKFTTGAWILNRTSHENSSTTEISIINQSHPITKGIADFYIFDELWINAEINSDFEVLGTASNEKMKREGVRAQPAIMVSKYGKGRIFYTILGHDARAMRNIGFKQLFLRGTEWAATGKVMQPLAQEMKPEKEIDEYTWQETDTTMILLNGNKIIWQYNFNIKYGKPFFHPVFLNRNNMTCVSPDDHKWHLGQWFCWKIINQVNYWEYHRGPFQSDGVTRVENIKMKKKDDFSAEIMLNMVYHPFGGENVLAEKRVIKVSPPLPDGKLWMDYDFTFEALADEVILDRTPILGEENGKPWGGYAGLSVRFSQDFMDPEFITPWQDNDSINGRQGGWLYMGFTGIDGEKVGSQIMIPQKSRRDGWGWYTTKDEQYPFYYYSPAYLYYKPLHMKKGETITLNYRVLHLPGEMNEQLLQNEYQRYENQ